MPRYPPAPPPSRTLRSQATLSEPASSSSGSPPQDSAAPGSQDVSPSTTSYASVGAAPALHQSVALLSLTNASTHFGALNPPNPAFWSIASQSNLFQRDSTISASATGFGSMASPKREASVPASSIPPKRAFDDDHQPAVSSPLNPDSTQPQRNVRAKKESLKKRESKGTSLPSDRATPDPKVKPKVEVHATPFRYKLAAPLPGDFKASNGPYLQPTGKSLTLPGGEGIDAMDSEHVVDLYSTSEQ